VPAHISQDLPDITREKALIIPNSPLQQRAMEALMKNEINIK